MEIKVSEISGEELEHRLSERDSINEIPVKLVIEKRGLFGKSYEVEKFGEIIGYYNGEIYFTQIKSNGTYRKLKFIAPNTIKKAVIYENNGKQSN